jgi:hypothetical protein
MTPPPSTPHFLNHIATTTTASSSSPVQMGVEQLQTELRCRGRNDAGKVKVLRARLHGARFSVEIYTRDAIESHVCSLEANMIEANMRVTNAIPLGCPLPFLTSSHCKLRPHTEGEAKCNSPSQSMSPTPPSCWLHRYGCHCPYPLHLPATLTLTLTLTS